MDVSTHKKADEAEAQAKRSREQEHGQSLTKLTPAGAFKRVSGNSASPSDILALQQTVGNKTVTGMLQRHPSDARSATRSRLISGLSDTASWHELQLLNQDLATMSLGVRVANLEQNLSQGGQQQETAPGTATPSATGPSSAGGGPQHETAHGPGTPPATAPGSAGEGQQEEAAPFPGKAPPAPREPATLTGLRAGGASGSSTGGGQLEEKSS